MAKVSIRVDTHRHHPEKLMDLMKDIIAHHEQLGASSPLLNNSVIDMPAFKAKFDQANALRKESITLREEAYSKMGQAKTLMGTSAGQNTNTEGTLYYSLIDIKNLLLTHYRGEEESLSPFGFNVVKGTAKGVGRPSKKKKTGVKKAGGGLL